MDQDAAERLPADPSLNSLEVKGVHRPSALENAMILNTCPLLFQLAQALADARWPLDGESLVCGDPIDRGGIRCTVRDGMPRIHDAQRPWLIFGTAAQLHFWVEEVVKNWAPTDCFQIRDRDIGPWQTHHAAMIEDFRQFLPQRSQVPAFFWASPAMELIANRLARDGFHPENDVGDHQSFLDAASRVQLGAVGGNECDVFSSAIRADWFLRPNDCDDPTPVQVFRRTRFLVGPDGRRRDVFAVEQIACRAHEYVHAGELNRGLIPAVASFYHQTVRADGEKCGMIDAPHLTLLRLSPIGRGYPPLAAYAYYVALRFDPCQPWVASLISGREELESFIGNHPSLRRLVHLLVRRPLDIEN
jgi:hypothetical protein